MSVQKPEVVALGFGSLPGLFVTSRSLVKKIQRVLDLYQQTFDFLPLVRPAFIQLFKKPLFLRHQPGECRHGKNSDRPPIPRRFSRTSVPPNGFPAFGEGANRAGL